MSASNTPNPSLSQLLEKVLIEHLLLFKQEPLTFLNWQSHPEASALRMTYPKAASISFPSPKWPTDLDNERFDLIACHLLPGMAPADAVFKPASQHLKPEGLLAFSALGPDTGKGLRLFQEHPNFHLSDMHFYGDLLNTLGCRDVVITRENIVLRYASWEAAAHELNALLLEGAPPLWQPPSDTAANVSVPLELIIGVALAPARPTRTQSFDAEKKALVRTEDIQ